MRLTTRSRRAASDEDETNFSERDGNFARRGQVSVEKRCLCKEPLGRVGGPIPRVSVGPRTTVGSPARTPEYR